MDGRFIHVHAAVDLSGFLKRAIGVFGQLGAVPCGREKPANARASRPNALGQIALGHQLQLDLARTVQTIEYIRVSLPGETANDLAHPTRLEQSRQALLGVTRIVVDQRQVTRALRQQARNELVRNARRAKATNHHRGSIGRARQRLGDGRNKLVDHFRKASCQAS